LYSDFYAEIALKAGKKLEVTPVNAAVPEKKPSEFLYRSLA